MKLDGLPVLLLAALGLAACWPPLLGGWRRLLDSTRGGRAGFRTDMGPPLLWPLPPPPPPLPPPLVLRFAMLSDMLMVTPFGTLTLWGEEAWPVLTAPPPPVTDSASPPPPSGPPHTTRLRRKGAAPPVEPAAPPSTMAPERPWLSLLLLTLPWGFGVEALLPPSLKNLWKLKLTRRGLLVPDRRGPPPVPLPLSIGVRQRRMATPLELRCCPDFISPADVLWGGSGCARERVCVCVCIARARGGSMGGPEPARRAGYMCWRWTRNVPEQRGVGGG